MDYYAAGWPYLFIGFCELIIIGHVYGIENFVDDLYAITRVEFNQWMRTHFYFIYQTLSPAIIGVILLISWSTHEPITKGDYTYPQWANGEYRIFLEKRGFLKVFITNILAFFADVGMAIALIAILAVPFMAVVQFGLGLLEAYRNPEFNFVKVSCCFF